MRNVKFSEENSTQGWLSPAPGNKGKEPRWQRLSTLTCHWGLNKVTEILFLESLTFDLSGSCDLSSFQRRLWGRRGYLKTLTWLLYNFPIFLTLSVLNCIGRWIFGIWGCQVFTIEDCMHWYTRYESEFWRDGGVYKEWVKLSHFSRTVGSCRWLGAI